MTDNLFDGQHHPYDYENEIPGRVAQKKIRDIDAYNYAENRNLLLAEAAHMRAVQGHRHIIDLYSTYECVKDHQLGMFVELADYGSLQDQLRIGDRPFLLRQLGCIAVGVGYLHQHPMRHRDLNPKNILIHQGRPKISDFGAAFNARENNGITTTRTPNPVCTEKYMPPEVDHGQPRDRKSDIWSLGCTFIEVLLATGDLTVQLPAGVELGHAYCYESKRVAVRDALQQAARNHPDYSLRVLFGLCHRMLEFQKEHRPSADEIVQALMAKDVASEGFFCAECLGHGGCNGGPPSAQNDDKASKGPKLSATQSSPTNSQTYQSTSTSKQVEASLATRTTSTWIWSPEYQRYYYTTTDFVGRMEYVWAPAS